MNTGGDCSFLYDHYHKIEARLCKAALPALLNVGFATLLNALFGVVMVSMGLTINKRYGGHGNTSSGNADKTVSGAMDGFGGDENEFSEIAEDDDEEEEDEEDAPPPPEEEEEDGVEMVENQYVYDDAAHEMPYVDEYTHLDDEHYFAMEADHDAETAII